MSFSDRPVEFLTDGGIFGFALPATHKARWKTCRLNFEQVPLVVPTVPVPEGLASAAPQPSVPATSATSTVASSTIKILWISKGKQNESGLVIDLMVCLLRRG